jgi:hypothetical protein
MASIIAAATILHGMAAVPTVKGLFSFILCSHIYSSWLLGCPRHSGCLFSPAQAVLYIYTRNYINTFLKLNFMHTTKKYQALT